MKRRHREYEPRVNGVQNSKPIIDCKEPAFTNEEFLKRYHQAFELQYPGRPMGPMRESVAKKFHAEEDRKNANKQGKSFDIKTNYVNLSNHGQIIQRIRKQLMHV